MMLSFTATLVKLLLKLTLLITAELRHMCTSMPSEQNHQPFISALRVLSIDTNNFVNFHFIKIKTLEIKVIIRIAFLNTISGIRWFILFPINEPI